MRIDRDCSLQELQTGGEIFFVALYSDSNKTTYGRMVDTFREDYGLIEFSFYLNFN